MQRSEAPALDLAGQLNAAQRAAVEARDGSFLVVAGAGTGKTRTLVWRLARLVECGLAPEHILLLTFTRRSAQEMLRRAAGLLDERCQRVAGGTFHSFANTVLRRHAPLLGYADGFTILDRGDAADLMGMLRSASGFAQRGRRFPRKDTLIDLASKRVNTQRPLAELVAADYPQFLDDLDDIAELAGRYSQRKRELSVMDYDDLLVELRRLLVEHDAVRRRLGASYHYVMVDEFQDTNRLQAHLAALLASAHGNLMVVGDEAQSIYSFRGADFRNIVDFPTLFKDCKTFLLEQNYRSTQPILDLGNAVLGPAREHFGKQLWSELEGETLPAFVRTADDRAEADFICDQVLELREQGVALGEMAVLCRAAWHTNGLELELGKRNIPFRKFGGLKLVETAHIKDVTALLRLAANPLDGPAWFRILQLLEGIGPATAESISRQVIDSGGDLAVLTAALLAKKRFALELAELQRVLGQLAAERQPLAERLASAILAYRRWMPKKYDDVNRRLQDLEALQVIAERYRELDAFLADLAIDPPDFGRLRAERQAEDEWLTLSTVHSAKGLEWRAVFVVHLSNGHFPSRAALADSDSYEEERRLLYVAVTRAKQRLYLLKPEEASGRGPYRDVLEISSLLTEIPNFSKLVEQRVHHGDFEPTLSEATERSLDGKDEERMRRIQSYFGES